jgi:hypothetical protein
VKLGNSYHDARRVAEYILAGGKLHPLSRKPFVIQDYVVIEAKLTDDDDLKERFEKFTRHAQSGFINQKITNLLGFVRTINFLNIVSTHPLPQKILAPCIESLRGMHEPNFVDYVARSHASEILVDALMNSLPDVSEDVMTVVNSPDLEKKRAFFDSLKVPPVTSTEHYGKFITSADLFLLIKAMTAYNMCTEFQL